MSSSIAAKVVEATPRLPLVVDLDGTLIRSDLLDESFAAAFFRRPLATLWLVLTALLGGRARLKRALCAAGRIEFDTLPLRAPLIAYLEAQKGLGRELHLATAADREHAHALAARVGLFDKVYASDGERNLKGRAKADVLTAEFPQGFVYAGDCRADLAVWRRAQGAVVVAAQRLARQAASVTRVEHHIADEPSGLRPWLKAARPHQWSKNLLVLAPVLLGWTQITADGLARALAALVLFCLLSSLTYIVNDVSDVQCDRRHATKHRRPFAAGDIRLRHGLIAGGLGIPAVLAAAWAFVSPGAAASLLAYGVVTLAYSMGLKRAPLVDCLAIGTLFTLRIAAGVTAADLGWSPWLMTFSMTLFFSLAMAKRHTEVVAGGDAATGQIHGRGFRYEDRNLVLAFGVAGSTLSILIVVLYLMEEVFPAGMYDHPAVLWATPPLLFLWLGRVWLLANRGEMHDDPVVFALRDRASWLLGAAVGAAFLIALL